MSDRFRYLRPNHHRSPTVVKTTLGARDVSVPVDPNGYPIAGAAASTASNFGTAPVLNSEPIPEPTMCPTITDTNAGASQPPSTNLAPPPTGATMPPPPPPPSIDVTMPPPTGATMPPPPPPPPPIDAPMPPPPSPVAPLMPPIAPMPPMPPPSPVTGVLPPSPVAPLLPPVAGDPQMPPMPPPSPVAPMPPVAGVPPAAPTPPVAGVPPMPPVTGVPPMTPVTGVSPMPPVTGVPPTPPVAPPPAGLPMPPPPTAVMPPPVAVAGSPSPPAGGLAVPPPPVTARPMPFPPTPAAHVQEFYRHLCILDEFFSTRGIKYWLTGGTLLGQVREQDFIKWDTNNDLGVLVENEADGELLFQALRRFLVDGEHGGLAVWRSVHGLKLISLKLAHAGTDIYFYRRNGVDGTLCLTRERSRKQWPHDSFHESDVGACVRGLFGPLSLCVPLNAMRYLKRMYGGNCLTHARLGGFNHLANSARLGPLPAIPLM